MSNALKWGGIALVVFYVVTQPANAASVVHGALGAVAGLGHGIGSFITNVAP